MIFDILRRAPHPLGENNLLVLADVGNRIDGNRIAWQEIRLPIKGSDGNSPEDENDGEEYDDQLVLETETDELIDRIFWIGAHSLEGFRDHPYCHSHHHEILGEGNET